MQTDGIIILKAFLTIVTALSGGLAHYRYALANYPDSPNWKLGLFGIGFLSGSMAAWLLMPDISISSMIIAVVLGGPIGGYISLKYWVKKSKTFMPPREK